MTIKSIRTGWTGISALAGNDQWFGDFESIASATLSSNQQEIEFTSIPSTYTHLQVRGLIRLTYTGSTNAAFFMKINGSTLDRTHWLSGSGSGSGSAATFTNGYIGEAPGGSSAAGIFAAVVVDILDYKDTNKNKTVRVLQGHDQNGSGIIRLSSGLRTSTNAVTSIAFGELDTNQKVASGTTFALYGIRG